ncbi:retinitis pigmentosa 1-like 1 protein isoform X2 [Myripristis murdjan]|uniref:retinitis pigmentosa 1-like 1 protein isoform X2 n=1 Tax=Myripristis murdjan TaxID=586833 RepID=UPI001175E175|nr:retinitis pigmentosa 1-like 1 protein isoform X2 [Myripristis murdjan]
MYSVPVALWDPQPLNKHGLPLPSAPPSTSRHTHLTTTTPAKRITFYKSGDSQFGGVRMAIHKRSFKCFDALLDDLSQKVPLPFGVRTVTTPRGTHNIKHLEQLQDGGCYLCSDRRQAKPINMELASKRLAIWHHHGRRPQRPEAPSSAPPSHTPYRQRRILLVKNSDPGLRRSVVLSRRVTRSLRAFLDEISELMQFHVRKLYTVEGRKIDSVQSLMTCPGVLVCVGREPFSPLLLDFIRKSSEERLPGLGSRSPGLGPRTPGNGARSPATQVVRSPPHGAHSRGSEYSEGYDSKKNVNFGLQTKKSIIHPRSDSSNRSTRFSLSSEKSYSNGLSTCSHSQARPAIMNDDIEKRVLVNKDGSLSVEMRVRFRLQSDETLQWSTQIKKSPSMSNDSCPLSQAQSQPHYLQQGQSESCSDPDSTSFDPEGIDYANKPLQHALEHHCPCCCQRQEQHYDLWENPAHSHKPPPVPPPHTSRHNHTMVRHTHSSSSSSSCHSRRVVRRRAKLSNGGGEQDQVVQEMCVTEEVQRRVEVEQDGDTHVEVCRISRCCSRSEVVAMESNLRPCSGKSVEDDRIDNIQVHDESVMSEGVERPLSAVSSSSHVLQALKEDQDDEVDDPPPDSCHCGIATPHLVDQEMDQGARSWSRASRVSRRSNKSKTPHLEEDGVADDEDEEVEQRLVSGLSNQTRLSVGSGQSEVSKVCSHCGGCKGGTTSDSRASARSDHRVKESSSRASSHHSHPATPKPASPLSNQNNANGGSEDARTASDISDGSCDSAVSTRSNKSNLTNNERLSTMSNVLDDRAASAMSRASSQIKHSRSPTPAEPLIAGEEEERAPSATSTTSHKSSRAHVCNGSTDPTAKIDEQRTPSAMSAKSNLSAKSRNSHKSTKVSERAVSPKSETAEDITDNQGPQERAASILSVRSARSNVSGNSSKSQKTNCSCTAPNIKTTGEERAASSMSAKSDNSVKTSASAKSEKSPKSNCHSGEGVSSPADNTSEEEADRNKRASSALSATSNASVQSGKACASIGSDAPGKDTAGTNEQGHREEVRPNSKLSAKSAKSAKSNISAKSSTSHKTTCSRCSRAVSPGSKAANVPVRDSTDREEDQNEEGKEMEKRAASTMSTKSNGSAKSNKSHKSTNAFEKALSPELEAEEDGEDRTAKSTKSSMSVKSAKSDVPTTETNGEERVASAMSGKSKCSVKSSISHKSNCNRSLKAMSPTSNPPDPVTMKTSEEAGEDGKETTAERASSAMSTKSRKSNLSDTPSHKCSCNGTTDIPVIETEDADKEEQGVEDRAPSTISSKTASTIKSKHSGNKGAGRSNRALSPSAQTLSPKNTRSPSPRSSSKNPSLSPEPPVQQLQPGSSDGEPRGPSALSRHSTASSKSTRSKCQCGASSVQKVKKEENEEVATKDDGLEEKVLKSEEDKEASGVTEQPQSCASSGSVSLDLPEDQEQETPDSDSGKSHISFHTHQSTHSQSKGRHKTATPSNVQKSTLSPSPQSVIIPTIETPKGDGESAELKGQTTEITVRASSAKSNSSLTSSRSHKPTSNGSVKAAARKPTSKPEDQDTNASPTKTGKDLGTGSVKSASTTRPRSTAGSHQDTSDNRTSSVKASKECKGEEKSVRSTSNSEVKSHKVKSSAASNNGSVQSVKTSSSQKKAMPKESSSLCPNPCIKVETSSESTLSQSLSAADLLRETMPAARPHSRQSKGSAGSKKTQSEKSGKCHRTRNKEQEELTPSCLPNASPNEVVSDWLRSIPANSCMLTLGDELNEGEEEEEEKEAGEGPVEEVPVEEENLEEDKAEEEETVEKYEVEEKVDEQDDDVEDEEKSDAAPPGAVCTSSHPALFSSSDSLPRSCHSSVAVMKVLLNPTVGRCNSLPEVSAVYGRRLSTSAKGLLDCLAQLQLIEPGASSDFEQQKDHNERYNDIMAILQSLWLTEPQDKENKDAREEQITPPRSSSGVDVRSGSGGSGKGNGNETPPKPTVHEGAAGEIKEGEEGPGEAGDDKNATEEESKPELPEPSAQKESSKHGEVLQCLDSPKATDTPSSSDKSSANEGSKSPTDNEREILEDSSSGTPPTVMRAPLSKRQSQDPDPVWVLHLLKKLEKQFMEHYSNAMAEFKVRWDLDDSIILNTMISELKDEVSRRIQSSIERELKKIQGRAGRGGKSPRPPEGGNLSRESTMTERRRRMLKVMKNQSVKTAESLSDEEMAGEFSDQRSEDEYCPCDACMRKKMATRPPKMVAASAPAPVMMEFDLLKILQLKKAPEPAAAAQPMEAKSDSDVVGDEGGNLEVLHEEEEEEETKEDIRPDVVLEETIPEENEEEGKREEDESGKETEEGEELEEKEGEEAEVMEEEAAEQGNEEEEEDGEAENDEGDEVQEVGQTSGEEAGEEEAEEECTCQASGNEGESDEVEEGEGGEGETAEGEEDEEEAEDTSDNTGEEETAADGKTAEEGETGEEDGENAGDEGETGDNEGETGSEEEESEKDTVKEVRGGETIENGEEEDEEEDEESKEEEGEEECVVSEFHQDEEETTGKESGDDEASGEAEDDNAVHTTTNEEESTLVEEFAEGNISASAEAEDEDDGDDDAAEGTSDKDTKGGESEEASEEGTASPQGQEGTKAACVTEGEEADAEDSDNDSKRPSDNSAGESGREGDGTTGDEGEREDGGGESEEVVEDAVEEFKPEQEEEEEEEAAAVNVEVRKTKEEEKPLRHQFTRTSVESQSGSMEAIDTLTPSRAATAVEETVHKVALSTGEGAAGKGQRRSRSPARVRRRKPKECDVELDDLEL